MKTFILNLLIILLLGCQDFVQTQSNKPTYTFEEAELILAKADYETWQLEKSARFDYFYNFTQRNFANYKELDEIRRLEIYVLGGWLDFCDKNKDCIPTWDKIIYTLTQSLQNPPLFYTKWIKNKNNLKQSWAIYSETYDFELLSFFQKLCSASYYGKQWRYFDCNDVKMEQFIYYATQTNSKEIEGLNLLNKLMIENQKLLNAIYNYSLILEYNKTFKQNIKSVEDINITSLQTAFNQGLSLKVGAIYSISNIRIQQVLNSKVLARYNGDWRSFNGGNAFVIDGIQTNNLFDNKLLLNTIYLKFKGQFRYQNVFNAQLTVPQFEIINIDNTYFLKDYLGRL